MNVSRTQLLAVTAKGWASSLALACGLALLLGSDAYAGVMFSAQLPGPEARADSKAWTWMGKLDGTDQSRTYGNPADALKSTFRYWSKLDNEGGSTGLVFDPPDTANPAQRKKFLDDGSGGAVGWKWPYWSKTIPPPGAFPVSSSHWGESKVVPGTFWGTNYVAEMTAYAVAWDPAGTAPAGSWGKAFAKVRDPWALDIPYAGVNDEFHLNVALELFGSDQDDPQIPDGPSSVTGYGSLAWDLALEGAPHYSSYLFSYSLEVSGGSFQSALNVAPGVSLYLNDFSNGVEWQPSYAISQSALKSYLDGFQTAGGWDMGTTEVRIGLSFQLPNSAVGLDPADPLMRHFLLHNDVTSTAGAPVPEPSTAASLLLLFSLLLWRERAKKEQRGHSQ